jgi:hypothetical protein
MVEPMYARVAKQVREHAAERARRARTHVALLLPGVRAAPVRSEDGSALADEVLAALDEVHTAQQAG